MPIPILDVVAVIPTNQDEEYYAKLDKRMSAIALNWSVDDLNDALPRPSRQKLFDLIEEAAANSLTSDASLTHWENSQ